MTIKSLDDIEREKREKEAREIGKHVSRGFDEFKKSIFPEKTRRKFKIMKFIGKLILSLVSLTIILGCILLLKIIIKNLFFGV